MDNPYQYNYSDQPMNSEYNQNQASQQNTNQNQAPVYNQQAAQNQAPVYNQQTTLNAVPGYQTGTTQSTPDLVSQAAAQVQQYQSVPSNLPTQRLWNSTVEAVSGAKKVFAGPWSKIFWISFAILAAIAVLVGMLTDGIYMVLAIFILEGFIWLPLAIVAIIMKARAGKFLKSAASDAIIQDLANNAMVKNNAQIFTRSACYMKSNFFMYDSVAWMYKAVETINYSYAMIPTGHTTQYSAVAFMKNGQRVDIMGKEQNVDQIIELAYAKNPRIIVGYTPQSVAWFENYSKYIKDFPQVNNNYGIFKY